MTTQPSPYSFQFESSYAGRVHYIVHGDGIPYRIELITHHATDAYWRKVHNGDDEDWNRNVVALVGTIHRWDSYKKSPIPPAVVDAFNAWRVDEKQKAIAWLRSRPDKYGPWEEFCNEEWVQLPSPVRAVHFFNEIGTKCRECWKCPRDCGCTSGWATTYPLRPFTAEENPAAFQRAPMALAA